MNAPIEEPIAEIETRAGRTKVFEDLYREAFPGLARWVKHHGGTLDDCRDVFQDALLIYHEQSYEKAISPPLYVAGIAKHLWLRKFRKGITYADLDEAEKLMIQPEDVTEDASTESLLNLLEKTGKKCLNLLTAFYYDKLPMKDLARAFGFSSERSATVQKYKCLEKLRGVVKEKALHYDDFHA